MGGHRPPRGWWAAPEQGTSCSFGCCLHPASTCVLCTAQGESPGEPGAAGGAQPIPPGHVWAPSYGGRGKWKKQRSRLCGSPWEDAASRVPAALQSASEDLAGPRPPWRPLSSAPSSRPCSVCSAPGLLRSIPGPAAAPGGVASPGTKGSGTSPQLQLKFGGETHLHPRSRSTRQLPGRAAKPNHKGKLQRQTPTQPQPLRARPPSPRDELLVAQKLPGKPESRGGLRGAAKGGWGQENRLFLQKLVGCAAIRAEPSIAQRVSCLQGAA